MTSEREAITYFESQKKRLEDFRKIYPSPNTVGYQATTKEISFYDMAISALSENKGDLISREWLLKQPLDTSNYPSNYVKSAPSVENKGKWTPVSERLPENGKFVLFCDIDDDIMLGYHVDGRPNTHFTQDGSFEDMKNVRAWQPLPKPYKTDMRGDNK